MRISKVFLTASWEICKIYFDIFLYQELVILYIIHTVYMCMVRFSNYQEQNYF